MISTIMIQLAKIRYWRVIFCIGLIVTGFLRQADGESASKQEPSRSAGQQMRPDILSAQLSGKIVFQSDRDGDWEIFVMNGDGSHLTQLTHNSWYDGYPVWSPDGQEIAFESDRDGNNEIYLMDADGSNQRRLTNHPANEASPAWSPDGMRIAFDSDRESNREIYLMNADGTHVEQWIKTVGKNALPAWSPDGGLLAYTGNRYLGWNVYVRALDKSYDRRITEGHGACRPDWSPDGRRLAYVSHKSDKKGDIWMMNPDGSGKEQVTFDSEHADYYPAWSPDGQSLAYAKNEKHGKHDNWELYIIRPDNGQQLKLTNHSANDKFPDWAEGQVSKALFLGQEFFYEAEELPHRIGLVREDPDASQGKAVYSAPDGSEDFVVYGPYQRYVPADYVATFRLKSSSVKGKKSIVRIEVVAEKGQRTLAALELSEQDFTAPHLYQDFLLPFALEQEKILEFRVFSFAKTDLWVDWIRVSIRDAL